MRKRLLTAGLAATFLLGIGTVAVASHFQNHALNANDGGVDFSGTWEWYSENEGHGGWHFWGWLTDTNCDDGDNVYSKVKVMAYSPNSFYGDKKCDGNDPGGDGGDVEWQNWEVYDYQATKTTEAQYWACRDRSAPYPDNCSDEERHYYR